MERIEYNDEGEDIGMRSNARGDLYADKEIYLQNKKIQDDLELFSQIEIES